MVLYQAETLWNGKPAGFILPDVARKDPSRAVWRRQLGRALALTRETTYDENGKKLTQEKVAARMGVDSGTISRWERGGPDLKLIDVVVMAEMYGMPGEWIVHPPDSLNEIEQFVEPRRRAAQEAARVAVAAAKARAAAAERRPRRGRSQA